MVRLEDSYKLGQKGLVFPKLEIGEHMAILIDRFDRALLYATHVHGGQVRKGISTPYIAHLLATCLLAEIGGQQTFLKH